MNPTTISPSACKRPTRLVRRQFLFRGLILAVFLIVLVASAGCSTKDPEKARSILQQQFGRDVPAGYGCKHASEIRGQGYTFSSVVMAPEDVQLGKLDQALRQKTLFLFYQARAYSVPGAFDDAALEESLFASLTKIVGEIDFGTEESSTTESITVAGERLEAAKILTVRADGTRLVRYRVSLGDGRLLVALGPAAGIDRQAMENIAVVSSFPLTWTQRVMLGILITLLVIAVIAWGVDKASSFMRKRRTLAKEPSNEC